MVNHSVTQRSIYSMLAAAGLIPFLVAAMMAVLDIDTLGSFGSATKIAASYGLAIVSFLAGAQWGIYLLLGPGLPLNLFYVSNAVVLAAWFPFVLAFDAVTLACLIAALAFLLYVDRRLLRADVIDPAYFRMRLAITSIACVSLLIVLIFQ